MNKLKALGIAGQKGGVGKTTLATCLAVAAQEDGLKVAIFDIDDQGSASFWHDERRKTLPHGIPCPSFHSMPSGSKRCSRQPRKKERTS